MFITYDYPPQLGPGRVTTSKLTKYLFRIGWKTIVLTTLPKLAEGRMLPVEIPEELIHRESNWERWETDNFITRLTSSFFRSLPGGEIIFRALLYRYDWHWRRKIVKQGMKLIEEFKPSIILASCGFSPEGLFVARELSLKTGIPWIAHMRDPWTKEVS
ncbi:MAG: hypothetical protein ACPLPS_07675, partial [bacterium]